MQSVANVVSAFSRQSVDDNLQTMLLQVFPDVLNGLQSLDLDANSTASEVVSAIMDDPGYAYGSVESMISFFRVKILELVSTILADQEWCVCVCVCVCV